MKQHKKGRDRIGLFDIINGTILLLFAIICVYPFLYVLFTAMSDGNLLSREIVTFYPLKANFEAFKYILSNPKFNVFKGLINSFIYTLLGTALALFVTYITGYALCNPRVRCRKVIMTIFMLTWVFDAGIIPQYIIYSKFGFVNNPLVMIVPGCINTQFLIITRSFISGIPRELEEAAMVDGANDFQIMLHVYMPLSTTIFATVGIFYAVSIWNQYLIPQIYLKSENLQTIQQVLKNVVITDGGSGTMFKNMIVNGITLNQQNLKSAAIFIAMLPIVLIYPFVQKYFRKGILVGSVKG